MSFGLSLVMLTFSWRQPGRHLLSGMAMTMAMLAAALVVAGFGPRLPDWTTVLGTNLLLLAAGAILHSRLTAFCAQREARFDRVGWTLAALTAPPFWYWGLIEPDGQYRAAVFSFAAAAINGRTAWVIVRSAYQQRRNYVIQALALLFSLFSIWMAARGVSSLVADSPAVGARGDNPTSWLTVFWYIILVTLMSGCVIWLETGQSADRRRFSARLGAFLGFVNYFRDRLHLLWAAVLILLLGILGEAAVLYQKTYEAEEARLMRSTEVTNDAFVQHSLQLINGVDTLLHSVRSFYLRTQSIAETEAFIDSLPFDRASIDNVYLISALGEITISHDPAIAGMNVSDRDYFVFHRANPGDQLFIGAVERGRITGKLRFRVSRRISRADGSFGGVVLGTLNPESFARYYRQLVPDSKSAASLVGTQDRKLRARVPEPDAALWQTPIKSRWWDRLQQSDSGSYKTVSEIDGVGRILAYKKVGDLPLVMVTGFSESDLGSDVQGRLRWLTLSAPIGIFTVLVLALLLTLEIRRRHVQDRFMSMLSHELKTPLSVVRMALGLNGPLSATIRAHAQQSVQDMDSIVERCLQVDRLEQRRHPAARKPCQVQDLLIELQAALSGGERLQISVAPIPTALIDTQLLRIALSNLIENAFKYSPPRSAVQVSASPHSHRRRSGILFSISNEAGSAGLPDPNRVFRKYYRAPGAHSKTGSGLGLYLVRGAARQMGGWVRYASRDGGVCFEFWIPV